MACTRDRAADVKCFSTYRRPSASPRYAFTMLTPRFQRTRGSSWPVNTVPKKSNRALSNGALRYGAAAVRYRDSSHAFHVGSGTTGTIAAKLLKNDGCARITAGD